MSPTGDHVSHLVPLSDDVQGTGTDEVGGQDGGLQASPPWLGEIQSARSAKTAAQGERTHILLRAAAALEEFRATAASVNPNARAAVDRPPHVQQEAAVAVSALPSATHPAAGGVPPRSGNVQQAEPTRTFVYNNEVAVPTLPHESQVNAAKEAATPAPIDPTSQAQEARWQSVDSAAGHAPTARTSASPRRHAERAKVHPRDRRDREQGQQHRDDERQLAEHEVSSTASALESLAQAAKAKREHGVVEATELGSVLAALRRLSVHDESARAALREIDEGRYVMLVWPRDTTTAASVSIVSRKGLQSGQTLHLEGEVLWRQPVSGITLRSFALAHFVVSKGGRWRWSVQAVPDARGDEPLALCLGTHAPCGQGTVALLHLRDRQAFLQAWGGQRTVRVLVCRQALQLMATETAFGT